MASLSWRVSIIKKQVTHKQSDIEQKPTDYVPRIYIYSLVEIEVLPPHE